MRCWNSGVLACSSASDSFCISGSSALILLTERCSWREQAFVAAAEDAGKQAVEHGGYWGPELGVGARGDWALERSVPAMEKGAGRPFWHVAL